MSGMQFVASKKDLLRLVGRCTGIASTKSTMPVLANVMFRASNGKVDVSATDLYLAVQGSATAEVKREGSMCIPARDLFERIKAMPDGGVHLTAHDNGMVEIKSTTSPRKYKLHGLPGDAYPQLPRPTGEDAWEMNPQVMLALINSTAFSIAPDETRPHLNSACVEVHDGIVTMVTTDGHRLTKMSAKVDGVTMRGQMLIPQKGVIEVKRLCEEVIADAGKAKDPTIPSIRLVRCEPNLFVVLPDVEFCVKLVDAQFPAYQQVIPKESTNVVRAPRDAMVDAIKAVALASNDRTNGIMLQFSPGTMVVKSESPERGDGSDELAVEYVGKPFSIGFAAKYLIDSLAASSGEVLLGMCGELDPMLVKPADEAPGRSYEAVVMPMRI